MSIEIKVVNAQQQIEIMSFVNGSNLTVSHGDAIKLLSNEHLKPVRKGNDLIIKNAKGEEFVLKDYYVKAHNADEKQLLTWDDELNQDKVLFSADTSEQIKLSEVDTGTVSDATSGGQELSAAKPGDATTAGVGSISTGMAMAGIGAFAVGGVAVAASGSGNSSGKNTAEPAMDKVIVNEAPIITSGDSATVAENTTGVVYQTVATDSDGDNITYSLSGADADWFNIDAQTGAVSFKNAPDYESDQRLVQYYPPDYKQGDMVIAIVVPDNTYDINVIATDGKLTTEKAVTVKVSNVDEALLPVRQLIVGTSADDVLIGTQYDESIVGLAGKDSLTGGAGRDIFIFEDGVVQEGGFARIGFDPKSVDTVTDFISCEDIIGFKGGRFVLSGDSTPVIDDLLVQGAGATALDANDYFIFDTGNGAFYFDADGNGTRAPEQFAILSGVTSLTASDIMIYASDVIL